MKRLLWIGDAVAATGFARCTHHVLDGLKDEWDVHVLGINYMGDPHPYPYAIYPAWAGGDAFGIQRTEQLCRDLKPDLVVVQNDPWNVPTYVKKIPGTVPIVASMPVDGKNCKAKGLNGLALAIFWTAFGEWEAKEGGYTGPSTVIPLGVDLDLYRPIDRAEARLKAGLSEDMQRAFIVGNVNRNQPRKRLDLTVEYFAAWTERHSIDDAYLFLLVAPTGDQGYDLPQLMKYYGFGGERKRLIILTPEIGKGLPEALLPSVYSCFDVQLTTTQGEGWGLTTMEGMACGVPQIVPAWSALGEWAANASVQVPCSATAVTPNFINVLGGVADKDATVSALQDLYRHTKTREWWSGAGTALVHCNRFRWENIAKKFSEALRGI